MDISKLTISLKLLGLSIVTVFGFILIGTIYAYSIHINNSAFIENERVANINYVAETIKADIQQARRLEKDFLLSKDRRYINDYRKTISSIHADISNLGELFHEEDGRFLVGKLKTLIDNYGDSFRNMASGLEWKSNIDDSSPNSLQPHSNTDDIDSIIEKVHNHAEELYEKNQDHQKSEFSKITLIMTTTLIGTGLLIVLTLWHVARYIIKSLKMAVNICDEISKGDLTRTIIVTSRDEIGQLLQSLKNMSEHLGNVVGEVIDSAQSISIAAEQISSGNTSLSQRTEEQASSLEETASSMEEMTATVKQNAENSNNANQLAENTRNEAEKGRHVVSKTIDAMSEINQSSTRIANIISTIDEIAFQTNLLALNAAVEAARAGDQGRGFAVVASEVRTLAQRSAEAAKEIKDLIEDSVAKVKIGTQHVDESGATLVAIIDSINKVSDIVSEINAASQEQSDGIGQVNSAVTQMGDITQINAALVDHSASASQAMEKQAIMLSDLMDYFKVKNKLTAKNNLSMQPAASKNPVNNDAGARIASQGTKHKPNNVSKLHNAYTSHAASTTPKNISSMPRTNVNYTNPVKQKINANSLMDTNVDYENWEDF